MAMPLDLLTDLSVVGSCFEIPRFPETTHMADQQVPERNDLIANAVRFLQDPKVQSAPLTKRIAFLESKGLTSQEIQTALQQSSSTEASLPVAASAPALPPRNYAPYPPPIQNHPWNWKDYTLATVGVSGLSYVLYVLAKVCDYPLYG
jgi:peroxin-14